MGCSSSFGNYCNGTYNAYGTGCSATTSYACNGSYNYYNTACSNAYGSGCNGSINVYGTNCTAGSYNCNGVVYAYTVSCSTTAAFGCNVVGFNSGVNCVATANSYSCNGIGYSTPVSCPTTASSYSCNGVNYSTPVSCLAATTTTCANGMLAYAGQMCPTTYTACANGGQVLTGQQCSSAITVSAVTPASAVNTTAYPVLQGFSVSYAAGWNIVAGPSGSTLTGIDGSIYTFQPGDTAYQAEGSGSPLSGGSGWWAYFNANTTTTIAIASPGIMTLQLPAGEFVMIGNSGNTTATVSGADTVLVYNPGTSSYLQTTQLAAGQGAWAISMGGGQATLTNSPV
jgi:hypothetical protein